VFLCFCVVGGCVSGRFFVCISMFLCFFFEGVLCVLWVVCGFLMFVCFWVLFFCFFVLVDSFFSCVFVFWGGGWLTLLRHAGQSHRARGRARLEPRPCIAPTLSARDSDVFAVKKNRLVLFFYFLSVAFQIFQILVFFYNYYLIV